MSTGISDIPPALYGKMDNIRSQLSLPQIRHGLQAPSCKNPDYNNIFIHVFVCFQLVAVYSGRAS